MTLARLAQRGAAALIDLVFPPRCVACGWEGAFLCEACLGDATPLPQPHCRRCARPLGAPGLCAACQSEPSPLEGVLSVYAMEGPVRPAVYALKYRNLRALAPLLGGLMASHVQREGPRSEVLAPVPLHPRRLRERGYNQSELLAREMGRQIGVPVASRGLARVRHTSPQARTEDRQERRANVKAAFRARDSFDGRRVLLVDDVCTTGATLEACAAALRVAGAQEVWGVTLAKEL